MNRKTFTIEIKVWVLTNLPEEEAAQQLEQNSLYEIPSVDGVQVLGTEWLKTNINESS